MTVALVLLTGASPDEPVRWAVGEGTQLGAAGIAPNLFALPDPLPAHERLAVILPGDRVATRVLRLPVKGDRAMENAARLAMEDVLAEPAEDFHIAYGEPDAEGARRVSAVPRSWFEEWMAALSEAGLDPDTVSCDHAALSADGYDGVVLRERGRIVAMLPGGGFTASESFARPLIERLGQGASLLSVRIGPSGETIGSESLVLADERALSAFYLAGLGRMRPPSFRRGRFAKRRDIGGALRNWRLAGGLMAACLAVWFAGIFVQGARHGGAADALRAEAEATFTQAFPDARIVDLRRQAQQRAATGPGGSQFLGLSAALAEALEEAGSVELSGLTYTAEGRLVADVRYDGFSELERLTRALSARGVRAQEGQNPRLENGAYVDRLTLEARS
ncbi:type II secretion system protein GspL [Parvularcula oceani]|uniref:type II secretion system protein GspL n=1 Tax=Parvularcula oceani TaxID=1247963 RepID=UPI0004E1E55F|nr:type II secretion system protein GspL [Parvularcula oceani]